MAMICTKCGSTKTRVKNTGKSGWFLFWLLGFIISIFLPRALMAVQIAFFLGTIITFVLSLCSWSRVCSLCNSREIIAQDSPIGQKLLKDLQ